MWVDNLLVGLNSNDFFVCLIQYSRKETIVNVFIHHFLCNVRLCTVDVLLIIIESGIGVNQSFQPVKSNQF